MLPTNNNLTKQTHSPGIKTTTTRSMPKHKTSPPFHLPQTITRILGTLQAPTVLTINSVHLTVYNITHNIAAVFYRLWATFPQPAQNITTGVFCGR